MATLAPLEQAPKSSSTPTLKPLTADAVEPVETPWHSFATGAGRTEFPNMPEFGTGAISDEKGAFSSEAMRTLAGYISTADEKELASIIKKAVPGATVKTDKFKNPIIRYREKDYYVNKPGISEVDSMQFVADVAAFAPAAKVASGLKGLARFLGLVGGGAATQIAKEGSTAALGGDQRMIDAGVRVGTAAVAAPAIEGLVKLGGMAIRGGWKLATNNGAVTTTARKILDREGIDAPDEMIIAMQNYLDQVPGKTLRAIRKGGKGVQAEIDKEAKNTVNAALARGRQALTGIPKTAGQESGDLKLLRPEQRMREGSFGANAQQTMSEFDTRQLAAIDDAVLRAQQKVGGGASIVGDEQAAGGKVVDLLGSARGSMEQKIDDAYELAKETYTGKTQPLISSGDMQSLPGRILDAFRNKSFITNSQTPSTNNAIKLIEEYADGEKIRRGASMRMFGMEDLRRTIGNMVGQAKNPSDKTMVMEIKKVIDDLVTEKVDIPEMVAARQARTAMGDAFEPRNVKGSKTLDKARTIANDLSLGDVAGNQKAIDSVLGSSGLNPGNLTVLKHLGKTFPETIPVIKEAAVLRAVYGSSASRAKQIGPQRMLSNLRDAISGGGKEVTDELFTEGEKVVLKSLRDDLEAIVPKPGVANPSGTAAAVADVMRKYGSRFPFMAGIFGAAGEPVAAAVAITRAATPSGNPASGVVKGLIPKRPVNPLTGGLLGQAVSGAPEIADKAINLFNK
jgi:hypothetical protein